MNDVADFRQLLADQIEASAGWRGQKAEEYPDDHRNRISAIALEVAAREIRALPDDDPRLVHLAKFWQRDRDEGGYAETENQIIGRHGFGRGATETTGELLHALVAAAWEAE